MRAKQFDKALNTLLIGLLGALGALWTAQSVSKSFTLRVQSESAVLTAWNSTHALKAVR